MQTNLKCKPMVLVLGEIWEDAWFYSNIGLLKNLFSQENMFLRTFCLTLYKKWIEMPKKTAKWMKIQKEFKKTN